LVWLLFAYQNHCLAYQRIGPTQEVFAKERRLDGGLVPMALQGGQIRVHRARISAGCFQRLAE
jgi:hypothetical protein